MMIVSKIRDKQGISMMPPNPETLSGQPPLSPLPSLNVSWHVRGRRSVQTQTCLFSLQHPQPAVVSLRLPDKVGVELFNFFTAKDDLD